MSSPRVRTEAETYQGRLADLGTVQTERDEARAECDRLRDELAARGAEAETYQGRLADLGTVQTERDAGPRRV